jgi:tryptophanyl-tRNA synthetase
VLNDYLRPVRERLAMYRDDPALVERIIADGTARTREIAAAVIADVKRAMRLT